MEAITVDLYKSLKRYYNHLFNTGYASPKDLETLLIYSFIEEIFEYSLVPYISNEDFRIIGEALTCLYGTSCVIPHPECKCNCYYLENTLNPLLAELRETENIIVRSSENNLLRATEEYTF